MAEHDKASPPQDADHARDSIVRLYTGRTLDNRYQLLRVLGRGGMGSVFFARHVVIGKPIAVKLLDIDRMGQHREYSRVFREAQTAGAIGHPNIIDVIDVGVTPEGHPFLVMEYLDGEDVARILRRQGALSLAAACAIVEPVLLALQAAHARNIVHRDIKPANIFVLRRKDSPPTVKLIDFGVAKDLAPTQHVQLTMPGALLGTPSYMPPEQATGVEDVDTRADVYGIGITLYEMLTGKLPFDGANYNETLFKIVTDDAPRPVSPIEELPEQVVSLLQRAMHKDPAERLQSVTELLLELEALDAWPARKAAFDELVASLRVRDITPLIDSATQVSPVSPLAHRKQPGDGQQPSDHVATVAEGASLKPQESVTRSSTPWLLRAAGVLSLISLVLCLLWLANRGPKQESTQPETRSAATPAKPDRVTITVVGAPDGAIIHYGGERVAENPFVVTATETVMPVRVEKPGYESFVATIIPNTNVTIRVGLEPTRLAAPSQAAGDAPVTPPSPKPWPRTPTRPAPQPEKPDSNTVRESGRGTFYTEKFE